MKIDPSASSFFKIIITPSIDLQKLRIPPAFTKELESSLEHAYLRAPGGEAYKVVMQKENQHIWFTNGWEKFADRYSLEFGHFLVFQYKGNSLFNVYIYGKSGIEIDYLNLDAEKSDEDECVYVDEVQIDEDDDEEDDDDDDEEDENYEDEDEEDEDEDVDDCKEVKQSTPKKWNKERKFVVVSKALEKANELKCENPSFIASMSSTYLSIGGNGFRMWVPLYFARRHMEDKEIAQLQLKGDTREKTWIVSLKSRPKSTYFSDGWRSFVKDNFLEVGDVCVFELIDPREQTYMVHIFRELQTRIQH